MAKCISHEECPRCVARGRDKAGDNLGVFSDGGKYCFSCGYRKPPKTPFKILKEPLNDEEKAVLPADFSREIPAAGWKWLLQYGLPYSYWKPFTGFTAAEERLVITHGNPTRVSIGRYIGNENKRKWYAYGNPHSFVEVLGKDRKGPVVLVEDIISNHKVAQVFPSVCLFGTNVHDLAVKEMIDLNRPVILWLDRDQYALLPKKVNKLKTFLRHPVKWISTDKDPKEYSTEEIYSLCT